MPASARWHEPSRGTARARGSAATPNTQEAARRAERAAERTVAVIFASLHKRAFGVAIGTAAAVALLALTLADLAGDPTQRFPLGLLSNYLRGYEVSVAGSLIGAAWGFGVGFVAGWFVAFTRNLVLTLWLVVARAKLHLAQSQDLLDHV